MTLQQVALAPGGLKAGVGRTGALRMGHGDPRQFLGGEFAEGNEAFCKAHGFSSSSS